MTRAQTNTLDTLFKEIILYRDGRLCQVCGEKLSKKGKVKILNVSHLYSKSAINHQNMRYMIENGMVKCGHCHKFWWHKDPISAADWYHANVDESRRLILDAEAMKPSVQMFGGDYEKIREYLLEEFEKIKNCQSL